MPRRLAAALIAAAVLVSLWASSASGLADTVIPISNVRMTFSPLVTPKKLSRVAPTPIALNLKGRIEAMDGSQPPAVQELVLDLDRHIAIDAQGIPVCKGGQRDLRLPDLKARCKDAIVGGGKIGIQFQFPEQPPIFSESELIVFNAGMQAPGETALYAVANLTVPITTSFPMTIEITRHSGGNRVVAEVPRLANGAGSLTYLNASLKRRFTRNGEVVNFLTGRCPEGKLQSHVEALFADGTALGTDFLQTCIPGT